MTNLTSIEDKYKELHDLLFDKQHVTWVRGKSVEFVFDDEESAELAANLIQDISSIER